MYKNSTSRNYLSAHATQAFHALLFGGDLLVLILWLVLRQTASRQAISYWWLASLTVTLIMLFIFARASLYLTGYRPAHDIWTRLALSIMVMLCLGSFVGALFHL